MASSIEWVHLTQDEVHAGDLVSTAAGGMPMYEVIAVEGGSAWLHDEIHHAVVQAPLGHLHWKARRL